MKHNAPNFDVTLITAIAGLLCLFLMSVPCADAATPGTGNPIPHAIAR